MSNVEHPSHYQGPHECIDIMEALFGAEDVMAFCRCNSFKYRFRAGKKEGVSAEEDIAKAEFYEGYLMSMNGMKVNELMGKAEEVRLEQLRAKLKRTNITENDRAAILKELTDMIRSKQKR